MTQKQSNIFTQNTFLGIKGRIRIEFQEKGISVSDTYIGDDKKEKFYEYMNINIQDPTKIKSHELYYLLVGSIFFIFGLLTISLFIIILGGTLLFLYFKGYQRVIMLNYGLYLMDDKKYPEIIERIRKIQVPIRKEQEYKIYSYFSSKEDEQKRLEQLHKENIITKDELEIILQELEVYDIGSPNPDNYPAEKNIISELLQEKGILGDFSIENITHEGETLPKGIQSISGKLYFPTGDEYEFWLRWDRESIDPVTGKNGYYTLGDNNGTIDKYGRSFFEKIEQTILSTKTK